MQLHYICVNLYKSLVINIYLMKQASKAMILKKNLYMQGRWKSVTVEAAERSDIIKRAQRSCFLYLI